MATRLGAIERRAQLWEDVAFELRRGILVGDLPVGRHLAEADIASAMGVSRGPVRQALRQLELESLVEVRPNGRTLVVGLSRARIAELYDARFCLERHALRLAVLHATEADTRRLHDLLDRMDRSAIERDPAEFIRLDMQFHRQFFVLARNRILAQLWQTLIPQLSMLLETEVATVLDHDGLLDPRSRSVNDLHRDILEAITEQDAGAADRALVLHLERAQALLVGELERRHVVHSVTRSDR